MNILAIESSCDETAVAVVRDGRTVLSNCIASQIEMHTIYGGVVPEIASRKHVEAITGLADQALAQAGLTKADLDAVAVTYAPGLIGAVLVGVNFAKELPPRWICLSSPFTMSRVTLLPITSPIPIWNLPSSVCVSPAVPPPSSM